MKALITALALSVGLAFGARSAEAANKYINDINWSQMKCIAIPAYVLKLQLLGNHLDDAAQDARDAGNEGLATVLQTAANEAHLEADQGEMAHQSGDCQGGD
jgi:hypothetical protein